MLKRGGSKGIESLNQKTDFQKIWFQLLKYEDFYFLDFFETFLNNFSLSSDWTKKAKIFWGICWIIYQCDR